MSAQVLRHFHPVMASAALNATPRAFSIDECQYVLFRDASGAAAALLDACPHRKAPLSRGRIRPDGRIACPYHGWHFDAAGRGIAPSQPSLGKCDTLALQVIERYGYIWAANTDTPREHMPAIGWHGYEPMGAFAMDFQAPLHVCLDNFSEDEHTPFVHTRLGWNSSDAGDISFSAENHADRSEVHYRARQRQTVARRLVGIQDGDIFHNDWETRFDPVRTLYDISWADPVTGLKRPVQIRSVIFKVPLHQGLTRFHVFAHVSIQSSLLRALRSVLKPTAVALVWKEIWDDAMFIPIVAGTPFSFQGMRLDKFDKPLVHNHRLLQSIYWGEDREPKPASTAPSPPSRAGRPPLTDALVQLGRAARGRWLS